MTDPDGDALTWDAETSNSGVVALEVSAAEGTLAVTAVGQGEATVTVTATDPEGLTAEQSFAVTVPNRAPAVAEEIPAQTVYKGETAPLDLEPALQRPGWRRPRVHGRDDGQQRGQSRSHRPHPDHRGQCPR